MSKVKIAMIGCGGIAGAHCRGLDALWNAGYRDFEIVATCDVVPEKAEEKADELEKVQRSRPETFEDFEVLLDKGPECDGVDICTLHSEHHTIAVPCLEAGKHVTIEKPLGITLRAAKKIIDAAKKADRIVQTAENYRLKASNRAIRWAIDSGMIGDPWMIFWLQVRERLWYWGWREHKMQAGAGWALDGGVHYCDLFRYFIGPVTTVSANVRSFFPVRYQDRENLTGPIDVDVEDCSETLLEFENGALGTWISTNVARGEAFNKNAIYGSEGSLHFDSGLTSGDRELSIEELIEAHQNSLTEEEREELFPHGVEDTIGIELHQFFEAVQGRGKVETDALEGYHAEAIALALFESDRTGRRVSIEEVEDLAIEDYQGEINEELGID
ncbi:MAG: Gfo/Idh/MocA family protein [Candidatus Brocadiia bacterium]